MAATLLPDATDEQIKQFRDAFWESMRDRFVPHAVDGLTHLCTEAKPFAGSQPVTASVCGRGQRLSYNPWLVDCPDCGGR